MAAVDPAPPFIPMLATLPASNPSLTDERWAFETKHDGMRAVIDVAERRDGLGGVHLWSRLGVAKTPHFPELAKELGRLFADGPFPLWLDGEIVAVDADNRAMSFQALQPRIHTRVLYEGAERHGQRVHLYLFDVVRAGDDDLRDLPFTERRRRLEALWVQKASSLVSLVEVSYGDGRKLWDKVLAEGGEGLMSKELTSRYRPGERSPAWRKIKQRFRQEFVVGGWTLPDGARTGFKGLLLGLPEEEGKLHYVGDVGSGFSERQLSDWGAVLPKLETTDSPFREKPTTKGKPRWVAPRLVVEVEFSGWSQGGQLWHPVFLGLRDDVQASALGTTKEGAHRPAPPSDRGTGAVTTAKAKDRAKAKAPPRPATVKAPLAAPQPKAKRGGEDAATPASAETAHVLAELAAMGPRGGGRLTLPGGETFEISNLDKVLWPNLGVTKGDLLRYYAAMAPYLLPVLADRPLIMRRFPNGVDQPAFYQHRAPPHLPRGVRAATLPDDDVPSRLIGGTLATLLYMVQLASISMDPFFSRLSSLPDADFAAIDLDPSDGVTFEEVLETARRVHDVLEAKKVPSFPKTSGARGVHIYIPLPPNTPYKAGQLFCRIISTMVAEQIPAIATVERTVNRRGRKIYLDYLQNIEGKTLAAAYSARASAYAGASTPLTWDEIHDGFERESFTFQALPARMAKVGDLWAGLREHPGIDLMASLSR